MHGGFSAIEEGAAAGRPEIGPRPAAIGQTDIADRGIEHLELVFVIPAQQNGSMQQIYA